MAASMPTIENSAMTAAHSVGESTTSRASSGILPAAAWRRDHARNPASSATPTTIIIGAGDTPAKSVGAEGLANNTPQFRRLLKPNVMEMIAAADSSTPKKSILTAGLPWDGLSLKLSRNSSAECAMSRPNA